MFTESCIGRRVGGWLSKEVDREVGKWVGGLYLAQVAVELSRETEGAGGATHGRGDEVVEVAVGGVDELERAEADVVQGLFGWVGGWVGWVEEEQAVGMRCCGLGVGGWVGR